MKQSILKYIFSSLIVVLIFGCGKKAEDSQPEEKHEDPNLAELSDVQYKTAGIQLGSLEEKQLSGTLKANGKLDIPPQNLVSVTVPFGGYLKSTELLQGTRVKKGQLLAELQGPDYIQLQENYLDSKSQLDFLQSEYQRQERLAKENVNAQKTLQQSKADYQSLLAKTNGLRARLALLNVNIEKVEAGDFQNSIRLFSPINGYVIEVNVNIGAFVTPADVMFRLADTEHMHADVLVFEKDIPKLQLGQTIRFTLANEAKERTATIHLIGREIGKDRTVQVHGHLSQEDQNLIPGTYLKAIIETGGTKVRALPDEAIVNFEGKNYIFLQVAESNESSENVFKFKLVEISTGVSESGFTEVYLPEAAAGTSGRIVVKGAYDLLSKMKNSEEEE